MLIFPTQTVDYVKTHFFFWYLPLNFAAAVLKWKHSASCTISWFFYLWVIMCIYVYGITFMYIWIHPGTFSPEENIWYPAPSLFICFPRILVPLWSWTYTVSWSLEEVITLPISALGNRVYKNTWPHPCFLCECGYLNSGAYAYKGNYSPSLSHLSCLISSTGIFIIPTYTYFYTSPFCSNSDLFY